MVCAEEYLLWNAAMNLLTLPLGGRMAGLPAPRRRCLAQAAAVGAACSLAALYLPWLGPLWLCSLPMGVCWCFGQQGRQSCLRCAFTTLCAAFLAGGATAALAQTGLPVRVCGGLTLTMLALLCLLVRLRPQALCNVTQVEIQVGERAVILPAMLDSGNLLGDPVTGLPVVVAPRRGIRRLFPDVEDLSSLTGLPLGFRLLTVRTAAGSALMPLFHPDVCRLYVNGRAREADVQVAVAGPEYGGVQALVPLLALRENTNHGPSLRELGGRSL